MNLLTLGESARRNVLLVAMPDSEWPRISESLQPVKLALGQGIYESGAVLDFASFPTSAIISPLYVFTDNGSAEVAVVGIDSDLGVALIHGWRTPNVFGSIQTRLWAGTKVALRGGCRVSAGRRPTD